MYIGVNHSEACSYVMTDNAAGACEATRYLLDLGHRGIRIPEDVSLPGYDNISFSALPRIGLTTVSQRKFRAGEIAAARLLEQIHGKTEQTVDLLQPELIVRSTCIKKKGGKQQ